MTHEPINTYRRRIAVAALHRIKRKTGGVRCTGNSGHYHLFFF